MIKVIKTMNQYNFVIQVGTSSVFQSYNSIIAIKKHNGAVVLSKHYDYSLTTMRHLAQFLGHGINETRKRLKSGEYILDIDTNGKDLQKKQ